MLDSAYSGAASGAADSFPLQAAGDVCHSTTLPLFFATAFDEIMPAAASRILLWF